MNNKEILIKGKKYPMRMTMGALRRFKNITGKEVAQIGEDMELIISFMYCCVASACNADGVEFTMNLDLFGDCIALNEMNSFLEDLNEGQDPKKK